VTEIFSGAVTEPLGGYYNAVVAVGVVAQGEQIALYSCGGPMTYATDSHWFVGTAQSDGTFTINSDGWLATGSITPTLASGMLSNPGGSSLNFSVPVAGSDGSGLYEYSSPGNGCLTGVVVWDDPSSGLQYQGTWCDGMNDFAQVIPVLPASISPLGFEAQVQSPTGPLQFWVSPAVALLGE
jgi:hypothetical protein